MQCKFKCNDVWRCTRGKSREDAQKFVKQARHEVEAVKGAEAESKIRLMPDVGLCSTAFMSASAEETQC